MLTPCTNTLSPALFPFWTEERGGAEGAAKRGRDTQPERQALQGQESGAGASGQRQRSHLARPWDNAANRNVSISLSIGVINDAGHGDGHNGDSSSRPNSNKGRDRQTMEEAPARSQGNAALRFGAQAGGEIGGA